MQQRSEAWYRERAGRITGSRFSRAMAPRNSDAYLGLISELAEERKAGRSRDVGYVNAAMQWGIDHEAAARKWYVRQHGYRVSEIGFMVHPVHSFVGVSPDGLVGDDGLIEIKCPQMKGFRQVMSTQEMPSRYRWQVQGQLWVCQRDWLDFVCFYPPGQGIAIRIEGDEDDFDRLEARCIEINREVEKRIGIGSKSQAAATSPAPRRKPTAPSLPPQWTQSRHEPAKPATSFDIPGWVWAVVVIVVILWLSH